MIMVGWSVDVFVDAEYVQMDTEAEGLLYRIFSK